MKAPTGMEAGLNWLLTHSLQAGVLVLLVLGIQWLFRHKLTHRWRFALWWVVLIRLLLPFSPPSVVSIFNLFKPSIQLPSTSRSTPQVFTSPDSPVPPISALASMPVPESVASGSIPPAAPQLKSPEPRVAPSAESSVPAAIPTSLPPPQRHLADYLAPGLAGLWLGGVLMLTAVVLVQSLRFRARLAKGTAAPDPQLMTLLDRCRHAFHIARPIELLTTDAVQSPALFGLFRLRLLVPAGFASQFSERELRYIFLHEVAHVKRGDLWLNWLVTALQIVHWFNPLLWLGFARLRADRELACDELALVQSGEPAGTAYGETVVKLLEKLSRPTAIPGLIGILEDRQQMQRRITMIARFRRPGRWSALAIVLVAAVAVAALTDAQTNAPNSSRIKLKNDASNPTAAKPAGMPYDTTYARVNTLTTLASTNTASQPMLRGQPELDPTNMLQMTVTVLDGQTGQPVAGARVFTPYLSGMFGTNDPGWRTDGNGIAAVRRPKIADYRMQNFSLSVSASNYPGRSVMWISDSGKVLATLPQEYTFRLGRGLRIGGSVQDEQGQPIAGATVIPWGSGYRGFSMGTGDQFHQEFSEVPRYGVNGLTTDAQGRWHTDNFPADLTQVRIDVVRPGGARTQFATDAGADMMSVESAESTSLPDLLATNATLTLKAGYTVRGLVVDATGKPVSGVRLKARGGQVSQTPVYVSTNAADGQFEFSHWVVPQFVVTAEADGYATKSVVLSANDRNESKRITLSPAKPLRIRVLGEAQEPVADAVFRVVDWRSGNQLVEWSGRTDAKGVAVWTNAPDQAVTFWVSSSNYPVRAAKLLADGTEKIIQLRQGSDKSISVRLTVSDAGSGQPLNVFTVKRDLQWNQSFSTWGDPGQDGNFQSQIASSEFRLGTVDYYKLQIVADGYQPWTSDDLYFDEGDQALVVKLAKGDAPVGIVRQPDGQPAAEAKVALCQEAGSSVFMNAPNRSYPGRGVTTERSASDGSFHLANTSDDKYIVAWHSAGFAVTTVGEVRQSKGIQLQAWASVEGVLRANGQPVANESVDVKAPMSWHALEGFNLVYSARTDANGHFLFTNLPPSSYVLYRTPHIIYGVETTESHRLPFTLKAGEHHQLDYGFGGRTITGHIESDVPVDWQNDAQVLVRKTALVLPPPPTYWSFINKTDYEKARQAYAHSPELEAYERERQQFQLVFDQGGNFHVDDVPPGQYELHLRVTRPPKNDKDRYSSRRDELGSLTRVIEVPAGMTPMDLVSIPMSVKPAEAQPVELAKPVALSAEDLDGKPVSLNQFRGKYVLLVFWASWSDRCMEQLASLKAWQAESSAGGKFTVLGVNLGEDAASLREALKDRSYSWPQARIKEAQRAEAVANFNISTLPSFSLIGPDGRLLVRNLGGESVRVTVQRYLNQK